MAKYDLIIDTDIGADCDDVVALSLACALEKRGDISIKAISACTARAGAPATIRAVLKKYGLQKPIGKYVGKPIPCDNFDHYAHELRKKYAQSDDAEDSVKVIRSALYNNANKTILVGIGPLSVLAGLLESPADENCPLDGVTLVSKKVEKVYLMAGNFSKYDSRYDGKYEYAPEWNVLQDVTAAQKFVQNCPVSIVFVPGEVGADVYTGRTFNDNTPEKFAIEKFYSNGWPEYDGELVRSSWDPITIAEASGMARCELSAYGSVTVTDEGYTVFTQGEGKHRFSLKCFKSDEYGEIIDQMVDGKTTL